MPKTRSNNTALLQLSILRILLGLTLLFSQEIHQAQEYFDNIPRAKLQVLWWMQYYPLSSQSIQIAQAGIYVGAILLIIGWKSQLGLLLTIFGSSILFSLMQLHHPIHIHHLWWLNVLLLLSPVQRFLSIETLHSHQHNFQNDDGIWALQSIRYCLGGIFLFPGIHKLWSPDWMSGAILQNTLLWKQAQYWNLTLWSFDIPDWSYSYLAASVAVLEVLLCLLIVLRKDWLFLGLALFFHLGIWLGTGIVFSNLWILYGAFLPWEQFLQRFGTNKEMTISQQKWTILKWVVHTAKILLLIGIAQAGIQNTTQGFPWIAYPSFTQNISERMPIVAIVSIENDVESILPYTEYIAPNNAAWARNWSLFTQHYPKQFEKYLKDLPAIKSNTVQKVSFWKGYIDTKSRDPIPVLQKHLYTISINDH